MSAVQAPEVTIAAEEPRGTKRKLESNRDDSPAPLHETLTPVPSSRSPSPHPGAAEKDLEVFDDGHSEYEWIRVPKERDWDLFKVARQHPSERDSAELPLVVRRETDSADMTMWAKMDTGADCNFINRSTVNAIFGLEEAEKRLRTLPLEDQGDFGMVGNNKFHATHYVVVDFRAGHSDRHFEAVQFFVIPDDWDDPNGDGIPNVILGYPTLRENSMIMIDLDYHQDADPALEVVAEREESEREGTRAILKLISPQTKGFDRQATQRPKVPGATMQRQGLYMPGVPSQGVPRPAVPRPAFGIGGLKGRR